MLYSVLALRAGIGAFQFCYELPAADWWWLSLCLLLVVFPVSWLRAAGFAVAGFLWVWWRVSQIRLVQEMERAFLSCFTVVEIEHTTKPFTAMIGRLVEPTLPGGSSNRFPTPW